MPMFTKKDIEQFKRKGLSAGQVEKQIAHFKKGFPFVNLVSPATSGNGILQLDDRGLDKYNAFYDSCCPDKHIVKFVPASGAATRMFKDLLAYLGETGVKPDTSIDEIRNKYPEAYKFVHNLQKFPFYTDLQQAALDRQLEFRVLMQENRVKELISLLVSANGLNYGQLPKGVLKFHSYQEGNRTAFGEHLVEAANYASNCSGDIHVHFTVSEQFEGVFKELADMVTNNYQQKFGINYHIEFSFQDPSTDTLAVDTDNNPFRDEQGEILFRPGGHGALLKNLNEIDADLVFIKNIDNVAPDSLKKVTYLFKKALGGVLLHLQKKIFGFLEELDTDPGPELISRINSFISDELNQDPGPALISCEADEIKDKLFCFLNRPIRVCGMVPNEGEPGGAPYWVYDRSGKMSLQIVELSQIDRNDPAQEAIVSSATHFNPVDLVCGLRNYRREKFNLSEYIDPETGFISEKSGDGKTLKALELPGLWNGSMADWITVFVEVPIQTFTPVKTINDLLRPEHQG